MRSRPTAPSHSCIEVHVRDQPSDLGHQNAPGVRVASLQVHATFRCRSSCLRAEGHRPNIAGSLGTQERGGDDPYPVTSAVRGIASAYDDSVEQIFAYPITQPQKVPNVVVANGLRQLHLDADDPPISALDDEIDFMLP